MISVGRHEDVFFIKAEHQTVTATAAITKDEAIRLVCPVDGVRFSLNRAEYRRALKRGFRPCCCPECGWAYKKQRKQMQGAVTA